jgi:hypothetical protein
MQAYDDVRFGRNVLNNLSFLFEGPSRQLMEQR